MADLKEVLIKGNWADEINRAQNRLMDMASQINSLRGSLTTLQTTISGSNLASAADIALINGAVNFMNNASVTSFESFVNANLPILE